MQVVEVLSKHAGLWITRDKEIMYSQATHINFICPMRFDNFPLDTQVKAYKQHLLNYTDLHGEGWGDGIILNITCYVGRY